MKPKGRNNSNNNSACTAKRRQVRARQVSSLSKQACVEHHERQGLNGTDAAYRDMQHGLGKRAQQV